MPAATTEQLVEAYRPLARAIAWKSARKYRQKIDDTYSDALFGLFKAADCWDHRYVFAVHAASRIDGEILHGIRARVRQTYRNKGPDGCSFEALPAEHASLGPTPEDTALRRDFWDRVDRLLSVREKQAVHLYYRFAFTQHEIAPMIGVSQMQVSRYLHSGRKKLKAALAEGQAGSN